MLKKATRPITARGRAALKARSKKLVNDEDDIDQDAEGSCSKTNADASASPVSDPADTPMSGSNTDHPVNGRTTVLQDYEVGYGKPPKRTQFRKGKSGNPKGRPPGALGFRTILRDVLNEKITARIGGRERRISKQSAIINRVVDKALRGDPRAYAQIVKMYGEDEPQARAGPVALGNEQQDLRLLEEFERQIREAERQSRSDNTGTNGNHDSAGKEDDD